MTSFQQKTSNEHENNWEKNNLSSHEAIAWSIFTFIDWDQ